MLTNFNPVKFSNQENEFLLKHLGEPSIVALKDIKGVINPKASPKDTNPVIYPDGVIPASVKPVLDGVYELEELSKHEGAKWVGIEKIKDAIRMWLKVNAKWAADYKNTRGRAPRYPSLFAWDAKGKGHLGGPGSDSGMIKTYFGKSGERIPFEIELITDFVPEWISPTTQETKSDSRLVVDPDNHRIECRVPMSDGSLCGHTETYKNESRSSYNAARARMSKHLRKAQLESDAHRELHTLEFGN